MRVGDPFSAQTQMGPLAAERQRDRVEGYIAKGVADGATLATGGGRPKDLDRGWYVEPTVFGNVDNHSVIAQEEIFGPVLSVIPADDEQDAVRIANDTIYGLNASVFTNDVNRARQVAARLRSGTVGHNAFRTDFGVAFGGFKQSGIGREGGHEGLLALPGDQDRDPRRAPGRLRGHGPVGIALTGHTEFGRFLNDLDFHADCQACGEQVLDLPTALPEHHWGATLKVTGAIRHHRGSCQPPAQPQTLNSRFRHFRHCLRVCATFRAYQTPKWSSDKQSWPCGEVVCVSGLM